jgi:hypothetical protein
VVLQSNDGKLRRRITAAAVRPKLGKTAKILLWEERSGRDVPLKEKLRMFQRVSDGPPPVKLDISLFQGKDQQERYHVIGVDKAGRLSCWSENLHHEVMGAAPVGEFLVRDAFLVGLEQARKGILKGRDDIATIAEAKGMQDIFISLATQPDRRKNPGGIPVIHLHGLKNGSIDQKDLAVEAIHSAEVPVTFLAIDGQVSIVDLTRTVPKVTGNIKLPPFHYFTPIADSVIATTDEASLKVIDTKHQAVLATGPLREQRKVNEAIEGVDDGYAVDPLSTKLVTFAASLGVIAAIQDSQILTYQIEGDGMQERPRKKLRQVALADAVGRGLGTVRSHDESSMLPTASLPFGNSHISPSLDDAWASQAAELEALAAAGDMKAFDRLAQACLGTGSKQKTNSMVFIHSAKIDHILSSILVVHEPSSPDSPGHRLKLRFWPGKTMEWLCRRQLLCQSEIEGALKRTGVLPVVEKLAPTALVLAASGRRIFTTLRKLLTMATALDAREVLCAIRLALQALQQEQNLQHMKLLTASATDPENNNDVPMDTRPAPNNSEDDETRNPAYKPYLSKQNLANAHEVIRLAVGRLEHLHPSTLPAALSAEFHATDLFALIDYLRLALAQRGWFSRYTDPIVLSSVADSSHNLSAADAADALDPPAPSASNISDPFAHSATQPIQLLNSALDTLGAQSWILRGGIDVANSAAAATTLAHMRAEVSAALEGVEEASYLTGLLDEVLAFASTVPLSAFTASGPTPGKPHLIATRGPAAEGPAADAPARIGSGHGDAGISIDETRALPLGLKYVAPGGPAARLEKGADVTVKAGGELRRRTARDMGRLTSMRVGAHSFERIIL